MIDLILDLIFPQNACCLCHTPGNFWSRRPWCDRCDEEMRNAAAKLPYCEKCGKFLPDGGGICAECAREEPPFFIARAVGPYEGCYRKIIKAYKFMGNRGLAVKMAQLMARVVQANDKYQPLDLVVPVPAAVESLSQRGFNQSELLARKIAKILKLKHLPHALQRAQGTLVQHELSREEREKNLRGAFTTKENQALKGKNILLVDDVYTTGITARECTRALLEAGARRVCVITWAAGKGY